MPGCPELLYAVNVMERSAVSRPHLFVCPAYTALCFILGGLAVAGCSAIPPRHAEARHAEAGTPPVGQERNAPITISRDGASQGDTQAQPALDELLVTFKPETTEARRQAIHQAVGAEVLGRMLGGRIAHVKLPQGRTVAEGQRDYAQFAEVEAAEPNDLVKIQGQGEQRDKR